MARDFNIFYTCYLIIKRCRLLHLHLIILYNESGHSHSIVEGGFEEMS